MYTYIKYVYTLLLFNNYYRIYLMYPFSHYTIHTSIIRFFKMVLVHRRVCIVNICKIIVLYSILYGSYVDNTLLQRYNKKCTFTYGYRHKEDVLN